MKRYVWEVRGSWELPPDKRYSFERRRHFILCIATRSAARAIQVAEERAEGGDVQIDQCVKRTSTELVIDGGDA